MKHLSICNFGDCLGVSGNRLTVRSKEGELQEYCLTHLRSICIAKNGISISSNLVQACAARGIRLYFLDWTGKSTACSILRMRPFMASATLYWNLKTGRTFRWRSSPETLPRTRARSFSFVHTPFCLNNCMAAGSISASFFTRPNPSTRKFSSPMPFGENSTSALKQSSVTQPKHLYRRLRPRTLNARSVNS